MGGNTRGFLYQLNIPLKKNVCETHILYCFRHSLRL